MVTGAQPNGLLWTQVANQMEVQPGGGPSGRQLWPAWLKVCLKRADVLSASQRTPSFASLVLQKRKKKGSRIVLKASSHIEKANITTQKRCQSSRQIFGCFFFFFTRRTGGQVLTVELLLHVLLHLFEVVSYWLTFQCNSLINS